MREREAERERKEKTTITTTNLFEEAGLQHRLVLGQRRGVEHIEEVAVFGRRRRRRRRGELREKERYFFALFNRCCRRRRKQKQTKEAKVSPSELPRVHVPRRGLNAVAGIDAGVLFFVWREGGKEGGDRLLMREKRRQKRRRRRKEKGRPTPLARALFQEPNPHPELERRVPHRLDLLVRQRGRNQGGGGVSVFCSSSSGCFRVRGGG